jgi:peroxiredoxin 2/4
MANPHFETKPALLVGKSAPDFTGTCFCQSCGGDGYCETSLADYQGQWLVLFFFPFAFSGLCDREVAAFGKLEGQFKALNCALLGVSGDSRFTLKKLVESGEAGSPGFKLLADSNHWVGSAYGVYNCPAGINFRGLFIIDPQGVIRYQVVHEPLVARSTTEVLRVLKALQSGGACEIDWQP